jgi:hypothetical protein
MSIFGEKIRKKWLIQMKRLFNIHCKEYYAATFCWWIPSSCENRCNLYSCVQVNARPKLFLVRVRQTLNRGKAAAAAPAATGAVPAAPGAAPAAPGAVPAKKPAATAQDYALGNDYAGTLRWVGITMRKFRDRIPQMYKIWICTAGVLMWC